MADELIDILDEHGNYTGEVKLKSEAHTQGLWHLAVHVWIYNSKNQVLFQKRAMNKILCPGVWDISASGHVQLHEKPIDAVLREMNEEVGLQAEKNDLELFGVYKFSDDLGPNLKNNEFVHSFLLKFDGDISELRMQKEEVDELRFISLEEFEKDILDPEKLKLYIPHHDFFLKVIEFLKNKFGLS